MREESKNQEKPLDPLAIARKKIINYILKALNK